MNHFVPVSSVKTSLASIQLSFPETLPERSNFIPFVLFFKSIECPQIKLNTFKNLYLEKEGHETHNNVTYICFS